jgi:hypothetical protein
MVLCRDDLKGRPYSTAHRTILNTKMQYARGCNYDSGFA